MIKAENSRKNPKNLPQSFARQMEGDPAKPTGGVSKIFDDKGEGVGFG